MFVQDPETGEWYDDENLGMYEPQEIPERPPFRDTEPTPLGMGLGGRYVAPRGVRSVTLPPDIRQPTLLNDVSYEDQPEVPPRGSVEPGMITGYGTRVMLKKPGESAWLTPGGVEASPEYVGDIQDIMGKLDRGEISETQLKEKIKEQEKPPGLKPTSFELKTFEDISAFRASQAPEIRRLAEEATDATYEIWKKGKSTSHIALNGDKVRGEIFTGALKEAEKDLDKFIDFKVKKELEKSQQATEWGMRERAAKGDLTAISALKQHEGEKKAEDILKREISDKDLYKPLINNLPKTKDEAVQANIRVEKYKQLYSMAEKGAGGLISGLKGMMAPVAEAMGVDQKTVTEMSESQVFQLMARAAVGSQRLMLVGSGQVSNYEQQLMQRLSGGSIKVAREAAKELFKFYIKESEGIVGAYNTQIDSISEKFPDVKKMYGYVGKGGIAQGVGKPRLTPDQARKAMEQRGIK